MTNKIKELYELGLKRRKKANFSTGFEDLDNFCKYLDGGDVLIIGGRPAMGKTNFAASFVNHLIDSGKNVLYYSLAQSTTQFIYRLVAEKIGTPLFALIEGKVRQEEVDIVLNSFESKKLNVLGKSNLSIDDIENDIQNFKPEIIFIDYIQLVQMPKAPNLTEATNLAIKEVKRIAVENNVIVVLLSQLSRAVEARIDKHPLLSDLRNGSLLEEISDIVLFVYREEYYSREMENPSNEIIVAKNTIGPTGIVSLDFKHGFFKNRTIDNTF